MSGSFAGRLETNVDGGEETTLHRLVAVADHGLERRNHVADDIFRRVMQQQREPAGDVETRDLLSRASASTSSACCATE